MLKRINVLVVLAVAILLVLAAFMIPAFGNDGEGTTCVPQDAYTETIVVSPAIPEVPGTPAIPAVTETIPATPDLWWNWSPNKEQGPFEGPPAFPVDARGTWQGPHENGGPSQDTYGTFQQGNGNGDWFHREQGVPEHVIVISPEVPAVPGTPAVPAVTQTLDHPAVVCDPTTPTPTVTPDVPVETETPVATPEQPEAEEPNKPGKGRDVDVVVCEDGVFVTYHNGEAVASSGSCEEKSTTATVPVPATEEGL